MAWLMIDDCDEIDNESQVGAVPHISDARSVNRRQIAFCILMTSCMSRKVLCSVTGMLMV